MPRPEDTTPDLAVLIDALLHIDSHGCENYTSGHRCLDRGSGRWRSAVYGAVRWCDPCIARDALNRYGPTSGL